MTTFTRKRNLLFLSDRADNQSVQKVFTPSLLDAFGGVLISAPRIDYIRTFPKTPDDVVIMDWALSFTPSDIMDITKRQALAQVNPKIVLSIRVGKGMVSKALPILLEDINFTGKMRYAYLRYDMW